MNKMILKQLISKFCVIYTITSAAFSLGSFLDGLEPEPQEYLKIFALIFGCFAITCVRILLDKKQWMLRLSFLTKRILFAPLYLALTILVLMNMGGIFERKWADILTICIIFFVTFMFSGIVMSPRLKREEAEFNQALLRYQETMEKRDGTEKHAHGGGKHAHGSGKHQ